MMIDFKVTLTRKPLATKSDDWRATAYEWRVLLNGQEFEYFTGTGLVEKPKHQWAEVKPKAPKLDDVLYSLVMDASACEMSFDDWCADYGYDTDSRKALETYFACQENTAKLRKAKIDIAAERERLQDY